MKLVFASPSIAQVRLLASRLDAAGIACLVRNDSPSQALPGTPPDTELWVQRDAEYEQASDLVADWQKPAGGAASPDRQLDGAVGWPHSLGVECLLRAALLLPSVATSILLGLAFRSHHHSRTVEHFFNGLSLLSPLLAIYTLAAIIFILRSKGRGSVKIPAALIALLCLLNLGFFAFYQLLLFGFRGVP